MSDIVNLKDIERLLEMDDIFISIHELYGQPPNWARPEGFESLSKIILEQQISLASAQAHFLKLTNYIGDFIPENILKLSDQEMRDCQISRQKSTYLRCLSHALIDGSLDMDVLPSLGEEAIRKNLKSIKGIGNWTTEVYLMFCLQSKDIFPIGDIALVNTIKELTHADTREEILQLASKWSPLRTLASYYLWHYYLLKRNRVSA